MVPDMRHGMRNSRLKFITIQFLISPDVTTIDECCESLPVANTWDLPRARCKSQHWNARSNRHLVDDIYQLTVSRVVVPNTFYWFLNGIILHVIEEIDCVSKCP